MFHHGLTHLPWDGVVPRSIPPAPSRSVGASVLAIMLKPPLSVILLSTCSPASQAIYITHPVKVCLLRVAAAEGVKNKALEWIT